MKFVCPRCGETHEAPLKPILGNNARVIVRCPNENENVTIKITIYSSDEYERREGSKKRKVTHNELSRSL